MDTNFQDCVYINFNLLVQVCLMQKIALGDQHEFVLANCYFKTTVLSKFQLLS